MVEGDASTVLVPEDRYAQMRNVWFLPSVAALELWLRRAGFADARCVDVSLTSVEEQRSTEWMRFQSLPEFLDPQDRSRTVEGLPAPMRATLVARKPLTADREKPILGWAFSCFHPPHRSTASGARLPQRLVAAASISAFISATACLKPTNRAWATMAWPMFSSLMPSMAATGSTLW